MLREAVWPDDNFKINNTNIFSQTNKFYKAWFCQKKFSDLKIFQKSRKILNTSFYQKGQKNYLGDVLAQLAI
jgi:hypothetical protein